MQTQRFITTFEGYWTAVLTLNRSILAGKVESYSVTNLPDGKYCFIFW